MAGEKTEGQYTIHTIVWAIRVLEILQDGPKGISEIARRLHVHKNKSFRIVRTLVEEGWVRKAEKFDCYELDQGVLGPALSFITANEMMITRVREPVESEKGTIGWLSALVVVPIDGGHPAEEVERFVRHAAEELSERGEV